MYGEVHAARYFRARRATAAMWKRVPVGPCSFISPFNFPLNLAAHKVAPAIAVGCPFVLKPASLTPIGALIIGEVLAETDLPEGRLLDPAVPPRRRGPVHRRRAAEAAVASPARPPSAGTSRPRPARRRSCSSWAATPPWSSIEDADLDDAVERMVFGAFYQSGQSCIGVQRILDPRSASTTASRRSWSPRPEALVAGDPKDEATFIGPMISEKASGASRAGSTKRSRRRDAALRRASATARCSTRRCSRTCRRTRQGARARPSARSRSAVVRRLRRRARRSEPTASSASRPASSRATSTRCARRGTARRRRRRDRRRPLYRVDNMPYGGVKDSGFGREGIKFAMEDMTEIGPSGDPARVIKAGKGRFRLSPESGRSADDPIADIELL